MEIPVRRMTPAESVTLSTDIEAEVVGAVKEHGAEEVTPAVIKASEEVVAKANPLHKLEAASWPQRFSIDNTADSALAAFLSSLESTIRFYTQSDIHLLPDEQEELDAATDLKEDLLASGTGFINKSNYHQYGETEMLLQRASTPENKKHIATLHLENQLAFLQRIHKEYGRRMGYTSPDDASGEEPQKDWYDAMEHYLVTVMANHKKGSPLRQKLLAPYDKLVLSLQEASRRERRRKAKKTEP